MIFPINMIDEILAVAQRNYFLASKLGVSIDDYLSLIR